jgi:DNA-binding NarL/FixJ family response regulator
MSTWAPVGEEAASGPCIVIADDHPLVKAALSASLQQALPGAQVRGAGTIEGLIAEISRATDDIDLVLLDLSIPGSSGFVGLLLLLRRFPALPVAILSAKDDPSTICKAMHLGASGYIPKTLSLDEITEAVRCILSGDVWMPRGLSKDPANSSDRDVTDRLLALSPQQLRILSRVVEGQQNKRIAFELGIAEQTVKVHVSTILRALGVRRRTEAAILVERSAPRSVNAESSADKT